MSAALRGLAAASALHPGSGEFKMAVGVDRSGTSAVVIFARRWTRTWRAFAEAGLVAPRGGRLDYYGTAGFGMSW